MTQTHSGSCQCGAVTYEVTGDFERFMLCHCKRCRKNTGSAHASNLFMPNGTLTWLSGEDKVKVFQLAGTRHGKTFCMECGGALPRTREGMVMVPAGSLDTDLAIRPDAHIFLEFKADWDDHLEDLPKFEGRPG